ncbi:helix-turn-helix domain-containing protein [Parageobacillus toebii]|uniref:helix-turn-helix domain-containing protein n=1 Tax=Parageobacillus toebii TaxID=153151 RepID=UPI00196723EA|nr:helix-turn-helix domain-containing protein [Parageobacillus toebii]QSB49427.1 AraC family transcriptional regulator [Parageobacillus toebii]
MLKILLVDDEYLIREAFKAIFKKMKEAVVIGEASSGKKAMELFCKTQPDITFLDINIPEADVFDLIEFMKRIYHKNSIILLSGYDLFGSEILQRALEMGADEILMKPSHQKDVIALIRRYMTFNEKENDKFDSMLDGITAKNSIQDGKVIQSALNYIEENYQNGITLEEVAEHVHISPFYLSKLFKKELKMNFVSYVTEKKMQKAKELLENTDLPVINIALELNYQEPNYFSKVFKKVVGITPSEYRKRSKKRLSKKKHNSVLNGNWLI